MDIPQNTYSEEDKIQKASEAVLEAFKTKSYITLCWTHYSQSVANETAKRFIAKGYHARSIHRMRGNGPSWFWYGVEITKYPAEDIQLPKSSSTILG